MSALEDRYGYICCSTCEYIEPWFLTIANAPGKFVLARHRHDKKRFIEYHAVIRYQSLFANIGPKCVRR